MSRTYRRFVVVSLAALLLGALPAAAAPATGWSLFESFSPFDWIRGLWAETGTEMSPWGQPAPAGEGSASPGVPRAIWAEEGTEISPWGRPAPTGGGNASPGVPRAIWAEEGVYISPWGQPAPALHITGSSISPWGLQ